MTAFQRNEQAAIDAFQAEMNEYGLTVSHSCGGHYANEELTEFSLHISTEAVPVKGNKAMIERLKNAGFHVDRHSAFRKPGNPMVYVFKVHKFVRIECR